MGKNTYGMWRRVGSVRNKHASVREMDGESSFINW